MSGIVNRRTLVKIGHIDPDHTIPDNHNVAWLKVSMHLAIWGRDILYSRFGLFKKSEPPAEAPRVSSRVGRACQPIANLFQHRIQRKRRNKSRRIAAMVRSQPFSGSLDRGYDVGQSGFMTLKQQLA